MMSNNWHELNKRYLLAKIKELNEKLRSYLDSRNFYDTVDQEEKPINSRDVSSNVVNKKNHHDNNETIRNQQTPSLNQHWIIVP